MRVAAAALVLAVAACGAPQQAYFETQAQRERVLRDVRCARSWSLVPGAPQLCRGDRAAGATLLAVSSAELVTGVTVGVTADDGFAHPGAWMPLLAFTETWIISQMDIGLKIQAGAGWKYAPAFELGELALAPVDPDVLARPHVWLGILGLTAAGLGLSLWLDGTGAAGAGPGDDANVFGAELEPWIGYPAAYGTSAGLMIQVAMAEEMVFRGAIQSSFARRHGDTMGWVYGSLVFGAFHAPNALLLPEGERLGYLALGVPFITLVGSYLGAAYVWSGYDLAAPVAIHFWYNFLLTATAFTLDPQNSPISASITIPF